MPELDDASVERWLTSALTALRAHEAQLNAANLFPVPDHDTGTNLIATLKPAVAITGLRAAARAAQAAAQGSSGSILAAWLHGFAEAPRDLAEALMRAAVRSREAVAEPVEGTMLTVADASATAGPDPHRLAQALSEILMQPGTPNNPPASRSRGAAAGGARGDAGALGLALVIGALVETLGGEFAQLEWPSTVTDGPASHAHPVVATGQYEVQFQLVADDVARAELGRRLVELQADATVITGAAPDWTVHTHVRDAGAAIEAGLATGLLSSIRVNYLPETDADTERDQRPRQQVVVLTDLPGLAPLVHEHGGLTDLDAVTAFEVAVLAAYPPPSGTYIPVRSPVQALAALAVHDPTKPFAADLIAMAEAVGACRHAAIVVATESALTMAGRCQPGDILGLAEGEVVAITRDSQEATAIVLDRLLNAGGELVTAITGVDAPELDPIRASLHENWPHTELVVYHGGQTDSLLLLGVE